MKIDREQIFRELEPPPGGAARMRARLVAPPRTTDWINWLGAVAVASVAAIAVVTFSLQPGELPTVDPESLFSAADFDRLLGRESVAFELSVRRGTETIGVSEIESGNPKVRIYQLQ